MTATVPHRSRPATARRIWLVAALLAATLTTGLTAGVFADWAHTIMPGLATTDDRTFADVFRALDRAILNPLFLAAFTGALVFTGLAVVLARRADHRALRPWVAAAFILYLVAVVITSVVHEPLNTVLRVAEAPWADPTALRAAFDEGTWVAWHLVRTATTLAALACLAWALVLHGHPAPQRPPDYAG